MGIFSIIMLGATAFFAYQIYKHIQTLEDTKADSVVPHPTHAQALPLAAALIEEADEAYEEGDLERALDKLNRANTEDANNPEILNKLAFIHGKQGNVEQAIKLYIHSLEIDDKNDLTHNAIASMYKAQGEFKRAQEHYEQALALDDAYAVTYYNYGNLLSDKGEKEAAREMYVRALELDPNFTQASQAIAQLS
jgi:tetratricopeptide (TPR) repeat protein